MSFSILYLFLILFQSSLIQQATGTTVPRTTDTILPSTYGRTETSTTEIMKSTTTDTTEGTITETTEPMTTGRTVLTVTGSTVTMTTEETTDTSSSYSTIAETNNPITTDTATTDPTTFRKIDDPSTDSTVATQSIPVIKLRSKIPENEESREHELKTIENNHATINVFGIVLASIASSIIVFYIIVSLMKKYSRRSYIVRSPSVELKQA